MAFTEFQKLQPLLTYAGPEPLKAVTASKKFSVTCSQVPTDFNNFWVIWASSGVVRLPVTKTEAALRTSAGVLGMTRTTRDSWGSSYVKNLLVCR